MSSDLAIPRGLIRAVASHRIVPFLGAGVSMSVKYGLFPSWYQLMRDLVEELRVEAVAPAEEIGRVEQLIEDEQYVQAAEIGLRQLGAYRFNYFLRSRFRKRRPPGLDYRVPNAIWALRPPLVITTNYDAVMRWATPRDERGQPLDIQVVANDQVEELALLHDDASPEWPWLWHIHGTIERLATLILAGSDYRRLYGGDDENRSDRYERALFSLQARLATQPLLYIGFSLNDPYVLQQIADVLTLTKGKNAPSYALMKRGEGDRGALWENYNIQLVEYSDHGQPLVDMLDEIRARAFPDATRAAAPDPVADPMRVATRGTDPLPVTRGTERMGADDDDEGHLSAERGAAVDGDLVGDAPDIADADIPSVPVYPEYVSDVAAFSAPAPAASPSSGPRPDETRASRRAPSSATRATEPMPGSDRPGERRRAPFGPSGPSGPSNPGIEVARGIVPRHSLEDEYARELARSRRLLVLSPRRGGARTMARRLAGRYGPRVTWLTPPNVPSCTVAEYFSVLLAEPDEPVTDFMQLRTFLARKADAHMAEHLVVVRHDGGPLDHLRTLGNTLRAVMQDERFHVLMAGEANCAWLRRNSETFSLYTGAPVRHVPPLSAATARAIVRARVGQAGEDHPDLAPALLRATGGHPGMFSELLHIRDELLASDDILAAATERLSRSVSVRVVLANRLLEDDRHGRSPETHARTVLARMLEGGRVRRLDDVEDAFEYAEVRLYYDGLVIEDEDGATALRCAAVHRAVAQVLDHAPARP